MDGRLKRLVLGGLACLALPAVGCKLFNQPTPADVQNPTAAGLIQQAGHRQPAGGRFGPPPAEPVPQRTSKKGQPFKPETDIAIADVELEAAFDESRSGADRDRILDVARQRFQQALKKDPKSKGALLGLAKLYTWANDRDRALSTYQTALQLFPKDKDVAFALARTQVRFEDWSGACQACKTALALDPENREYRKAYGYMLARADRWDEAFATLEKLMGEAEARTFLGVVLLNTGDLARGRQQIEAVLTADPRNEKARTLLADLDEYTQQQALQPAGVR